MAKPNDGTDSFPHDLWLIKILPIVSPPSLHRIPFIPDPRLAFIALRQGLFVLKHMSIYRRVLLHECRFSLFRCALDRLIELKWKMPRNIDQPQPSPIIAVPFDVFAAQNRSYQIRGALAFLFRLAIGKDLVALCGADNKGFVAAGLDAIVDLDIPVF